MFQLFVSERTTAARFFFLTPKLFQSRSRGGRTPHQCEIPLWMTAVNSLAALVGVDERHYKQWIAECSLCCSLQFNSFWHLYTILCQMKCISHILQKRFCRNTKITVPARDLAWNLQLNIETVIASCNLFHNQHQEIFNVSRRLFMSKWCLIKQWETREAFQVHFVQTSTEIRESTKGWAKQAT